MIRHILLHFWTKPREVARDFLERGNLTLAYGFILIYGISQGLLQYVLFHLIYPEMSAWTLIILPLVCVVFGFFYLYACGWLYSVIGRKLLKGVGTFQELKRIVGLNFYPSAVLSVCSFLIYSLPWPLTINTMSLFLLAICIWNFVLLTKSVAEAHRFSAWKGLATVALVLLLLLLVTLMVAPLFYPFTLMAK